MPSFNMEAAMQIIWLVLLIVFAASEAATVGLTSIWFAAGAFTALVAALLGGPLWVQLTLFFAVSLLCLIAVRPLAKKHLNSRVEHTNADRVIGAKAQVTEDIDNIHGKGAVVIRGMPWSACRGRRAHRRRHHGKGAAHRGGQGVRGTHRRPGVRRRDKKLVTKRQMSQHI